MTERIADFCSKMHLHLLTFGLYRNQKANAPAARKPKYLRLERQSLEFEVEALDGIE